MPFAKTKKALGQLVSGPLFCSRESKCGCTNMHFNDRVTFTSSIA